VTGVKNTIKSKAGFDRLFRTGKRLNTASILVIMKDRESSRGQKGRVAFVAAKRLGPAPLRNRCKRRMREAARLLGSPWNGYDVIVMARNNTATARFDQLLDDLASILRRMGVAEGEGK
jgi:ribonuclease P protein component